MKRMICGIVSVAGLGLALSAGAATTALADWPAGSSPREIGAKLSERFLSRSPEQWNYRPKRIIMYWTVCTWYGALEYAVASGNANLEQRLIRQFDPLLAGGSLADCVPQPRHVDYSMFGGLPLTIARLTGKERYLKMGLHFADQQWSPQPKGWTYDTEAGRAWLKEGYTPQTRLWMDDMFMITFVQLAAYRATGDRKYAERASREMTLYLDRLQNRDGLFYHAKDVPFVWGRGDGWMAAGMAMLLKALPKDDANYRRILSGYRLMMGTLLRFQRPDGLWGQLVDDPDIWPETSGSAMFAYAFIEGVRQGWLDERTYAPAARRAYLALVGELTAEGDLKNVCMGTNAKNDRQWYVDRPRLTGDLHGQAPLLWCCAALLPAAAPAAHPVPEKCHLDHFEDEIMAIVHYGLNSFCDKEWGYGDTSPAIFNPTRLDANQWIEAMKSAGVKRVVMVTKHHDGFNLWPSKYNHDYTVANSPWRGGKGDLVREVRDACQRAGVRFGTYLSPWDRHQATYATPAYTEYYHRQFDELFDNYGPISEIWLDGANGGDGWYGGAREKRKLTVSAWDYYRMPDVIRKMVRRYPDAIAFGGENVHSAVWVGNEKGIAPESVWYETERGFWETPECDVPLRRGWFWTAKDAPKSLKRLVEIYFASVGRGCVLNLGIAPNREGLVGDDDAKRLKEFGDYVRAFNAVDFAESASVARSDRSCELKLVRPAKVNCVDIRERIEAGQFVSGWKAEAKVRGNWMVVAEGTTVGNRRLARFEPVETDGFRVTVTAAVGPAKLGSVALRWAETVAGEETASTHAPLRGKGKYYTLDESAPANEIVFRFRNPMRIAGFQFDPKNNRNVPVDRFAVYASADGKTWTKVVEDEFGNMAANPVIQYCWFEKPVSVRALRIVALRTADGTKPTVNRADENCILLY